MGSGVSLALWTPQNVPFSRTDYFEDNFSDWIPITNRSLKSSTLNLVLLGLILYTFKSGSFCH